MIEHCEKKKIKYKNPIITPMFKMPFENDMDAYPTTITILHNTL